MPNCKSYNCLDLGDYEITLDNCATYRTGGSSNLLLLACDSQLTDPTSKSQVDAEILAGRAWLIENVKAGISAPSPETVASNTSCGNEIVVNNVYTGTIYDSKVTEENTAFWGNLAAGYVIGGMIMGVCPTDGLTDMLIYIDAQVNFSGGLVLPDTNADLVRYEINFTFKKKKIETLADTEGIFS